MKNVQKEKILEKDFILQHPENRQLHCIAAHRKRNSFVEIEKEMAQYDVIAGKIADDATNRTLVAYVSGTFGKEELFNNKQ